MFHATAASQTLKPVLLADIGEGIVECEIIQWFVEPGARVEEFSPLCEVQSDKASVEITSRFSGVVKRLYYEPGELAKVGKPFVDIDTPLEPDLPELTFAHNLVSHGSDEALPAASTDGLVCSTHAQPEEAVEDENSALSASSSILTAAVATPAVRHLCKELQVDLVHVCGSGKDGRVLKEDVLNFVRARDSPASDDHQMQGRSPNSTQQRFPDTEEKTVQLTRAQLHMFKTMTRSLAIPHFLFADEIDFTNLCELRTRLNKVLAVELAKGPGVGLGAGVSKLTFLPFIIKAVSMALNSFPILNARIDCDPTTDRPTVVMRSQHNIGVAMDTPSGLVVPVVRDVGGRNVLGIALELIRLHKAAIARRLVPADLAGATITVSNVGNIGGTYLSPVIVEREVAILGIGRMRAVPSFAADGSDRIVRRQVCNFSWSADHRIVDGATLARASDVVRAVVEEPELMVMHLR